MPVDTARQPEERVESGRGKGATRESYRRPVAGGGVQRHRVAAWGIGPTIQVRYRRWEFGCEPGCERYIRENGRVEENVPQPSVALCVCGIALAATAPASGQISTLPYFEDFESSAGGYSPLGTIPSWELGAPAATFIQGAGDGTSSWVTNLTGPCNINENSWLESPVFDFSALAEDPVLEFLHIFETGCCDQTFVHYSINGAPYQTLGAAGDPCAVNWYNDVFDNWWDGASGAPGEWRTARHLVEGGAGNQVTFRWRMMTDPLIFTATGEGVGVDAVSVFLRENDVSVVSIDSLGQGTSLSSAEQVAVTVKNFGTAPASGFPIQLDVSGVLTTSLTESFPGVLAPSATAQFTFATALDFSAPGEYTVAVAAQLPGDELVCNDALSLTVDQDVTVSSFPYVEDFESGDGGFTHYGLGSSWELGFPSGSFVFGTGDGTGAWATNLDGFYNDGELSYLQTPFLDFSGLAVDPFLQFEHLFDLDFGDESWVEVSIDGGLFTKLGEAGSPGSLNWYNDSFGDWWDNTSGSPGQWRTARHLLHGTAGHEVRVRWVLQAGSFVNDDGVGVDRVEIFEAPLGSGQPPQPGVAVLDVLGATDALGFSPSSGVPGPFFALASVTGDVFDLSVEGEPDQPLILGAGTLQVGAAVIPPFGQLDLAVGFQILGSGLDPGVGLGVLFVTDANGQMNLSTTIPLGLVGEQMGLQAAVLNSVSGLTLSNAVQVAFVP